MSLLTSLVDLDNIISTVPRSQFSEAELANLAQIIIESGGLVQPIILKRTGVETCEIVEGNFEYYATLKATEIDNTQSDKVRAFIIEPEKEEIIKDQVELLSSIRGGTSIVKPPDKIVDLDNVEHIALGDIREIKALIQQVGKSIQNKVDNLTNNVQKLEERSTIKGIDTLLKNQLEAIRQEVSTRSKDEALKLLSATEYSLSKQIEAIAQEINELKRVNLLTATKEEIKQALDSNKFKIKEFNAICNAIDHWKQPGKTLTWENLEKSTKPKKGNPDKIDGFGIETYKKLRNVADIRD